MKHNTTFPSGIMIDDIKVLGTVVRDERRRQGLTQQEAAGLCNVGVRFLSELENGKATLQIGKVLHVLNAFGLALSIAPRFMSARPATS